MKSETPTLFSGPAPRIFSLPPGLSFLEHVVRGVQQSFQVSETLSPATNFSDLRIFVPTRRAARALEESFLAHASQLSQSALLLPRCLPLGDVPEDEEPFEPGEIAGMLPPKISPTARRFEMMRLILAREEAAGRCVEAGHALFMADALLEVMDDMEREDVKDFQALDDDFKAFLPHHFQEAAGFIPILGDFWPQHLKSLGRMEPLARRAALLRLVARRWRAHPPAYPVLAAGSTGSLSATADFLSVVAGLPLGAVLLPGLDLDLDEKAWDVLDDQHPQKAMKELLEHLGVERSQVRPFPFFEETEQKRARRQLIYESLRPANAVEDWLQRLETLRGSGGKDPVCSGLEGLSCITAATEEEEATLIALALRETLENPDQNAMLVTPSASLARRVRLQLSRWGLRPDSSVGEPLSQTGHGVFFALILSLIRDPGDVVVLTALLKHPLTGLGFETSRRLRLAGILEEQLFRGPRREKSWRAWCERCEDLKHIEDCEKENVKQLLHTLEHVFSLFTDHHQERDLKDFTEALICVGEELVKRGGEDENSRLWRGDAGEAAALFFSGVLDSAAVLPPLSFEAFEHIITTLMRDVTVRTPLGSDPRIRILGPLEARLITADRVILGGLNEGVWPAYTTTDPFLSSGMRQKLELSSPEKRLGLAAHDFAQLACGSDVLITRSERSGETPALASRWLWRLQTLIRGALGEKEGEKALQPDKPWRLWARELDASPDGRAHPALPPEPRPPCEARWPQGRRLSVTQIKTWVRDPYALYARYVLGLKPLEEPGAEAGPAERGNAVHQAVEHVIKAYPSSWPDDVSEVLYEALLKALANTGFSEEDLAFQAPRLQRLCEDFRDWEKQRRERGYLPRVLEVSGKMVLPLSAGDFTLKARADRLDEGSDGWAVLDYKTGIAPSKKLVQAGFDPQMPLEAAILMKGGFEGVRPQEPVALTYVELRDSSGVKEKSLQDKEFSPQHYARTAEQGLKRLIERFDDPKTPYRSQIRAQYKNEYGEYNHLARYKEWTSRVGEET